MKTNHGANLTTVLEFKEHVEKHIELYQRIITESGCIYCIEVSNLILDILQDTLKAANELITQKINNV